MRLEAVNYTRALDHALTALDHLPCRLRLLRETHAILMSGGSRRDDDPGEFRRSQNWIGPPGSTLQTARLVPPPVEAMNDALTDLERFLHEDEQPNLVVLAPAHYQFEAIHPFLDGNDRIGRLLVPLALCQRGVLERPMLYLSAYFERHRSRYDHLLLETTATGDPTPWITFLLDGVTRQSRDAQERTVSLVDLQREIRDELLAAKVTDTTLRLAKSLLDGPYVTAKRITRQFQVTPPTAQKAIGSLVDQGILTEVTGRKRNRVYLPPRNMEAAYGTTGDDAMAGVD